MPLALKFLSVPESRLRPPSLRCWLCGATKELNGFVVKHRKPREHDVASMPRSFGLGSRRLDSVLVLWSKPTKLCV
jgi:hypothetical protein